MSIVLAFAIAGACLWRGLTTDEVTAVERAVMLRLKDRDVGSVTAAEAHDILDTAIVEVVTVARGGSIEDLEAVRDALEHDEPIMRAIL